MTRTYSSIAGLALMLAIGASSAQAGTTLNGIHLNGIHLNGIHLNGIHLNGLGAQGAERSELPHLARQAIAARAKAGERAEQVGRGPTKR